MDLEGKLTFAGTFERGQFGYCDYCDGLAEKVVRIGKAPAIRTAFFCRACCDKQRDLQFMLAIIRDQEPASAPVAPPALPANVQQVHNPVPRAIVQVFAGLVVHPLIAVYSLCTLGLLKTPRWLTALRDATTVPDDPADYPNPREK